MHTSGVKKKFNLLWVQPWSTNDAKLPLQNINSQNAVSPMRVEVILKYSVGLALLALCDKKKMWAIFARGVQPILAPMYGTWSLKLKKFENVKG